MKISSVDIKPSLQRVIFEGDFDAAGTQEVRGQLEAIASKDKGDIILDLSSVNFLDSSGVGAMVFLFKRLFGKGRQLEIAGARGQPLELLEMLRVDQAIPLYKDQRTAGAV